MPPILVTGSAGFIGYHVAERLLADGHAVVGLDVVNAYYEPSLKEARLARLARHADYRHERVDLTDRGRMEAVFAAVAPPCVIHLAGQAGVRHSVDHPHDYVQSNVVGFMNILEGCRHHSAEHLLFASSASVYGSNLALPFHESQAADHPLSIYAATKKANEVMAHSYAHLHGLPCTGLRFFTVYGPWGRPDMALFTFAKKILAGETIEIYNHGELARAFTYIDDIVEGVVRLVDHPASPDPGFDRHLPDPSISNAPFRVYNIGRDEPVPLMTLISALERCLSRQADKRFLPMHAGDISSTWAAGERLSDAVGYRPSTSVEEGVARFVEWYLSYYGDGA